jgi:hypothetical protein
VSHNPAAVCFHSFDRTIKGSSSLREWPKLPPKPVLVPMPFDGRRPMRISPNKGGQRTSLEILSRIAGGTTYRVPGGGRSTASSRAGVDDLAYALGFVRDPLDQRLALALACRTDAEWLEVQRLAYPQLRRQLLASHNTRAAVTGAKRYRIRLVLHDVFHDLALARPTRDPRQSAVRLHIPMRDYRALYKSIAGFVETRAQAGAFVACRALFGE